MLYKKIILTVKRLEDSKNPLLGPNIVGLYWFGLWQGKRKYRDALFNFIHFCSLLYVISQFAELYFMENDLMSVLFNIAITALSLVSIAKTLFFLTYIRKWRVLINNISSEEIDALAQGDAKVLKYMSQYKEHSRLVTYLYWLVMFLTTIVIIFSPFLKFTSNNLREMVKNGTEALPQIMSSWFPFNHTVLPGYLVAVIVHISMVIQGAGVVAVYDSTAVSIMSFLKGQMQILRYKCENIFGGKDKISRDEILNNIRECHRLHNFFIEQYKIFNSNISPVMFIYMLVCSIMICCSVVQLSLGKQTMSQKLWVFEYTMALAVQLFLYCWHSNEIAHESKSVDRGVYTSNWWQGDVEIRRQILLLAGKLAPTFILEAGPFTTFSMSTFIDILKGSYSFYTLFTQMHEKEG
ncbi:unnamed protein product, partial [Brenthis ino]